MEEWQCQQSSERLLELPREVFTVETRRQEIVALPDACCHSCNNPGVNKSGNGFIDKVSYTLPVGQELAERHPDKIQAVMELMSRYYNIVKD